MFLPVEVLEFGNSCPGFLPGVIDDGGRLVPFLFQGNEIHLQGSILQLAVFIAKEAVHFTREDCENHTGKRGVAEKIMLQVNVDIRMVKHPADHFSEAFPWDTLERVGKIPVIVIETKGNSFCHICGQFFWRPSPLFFGVMPEKGLVKPFPNLGDDLVAEIGKRIRKNGPRNFGFKEFGHLLRSKAPVHKLAKRVKVDGKGQQFPVDMSKDTVLVRKPFGEAAKEIPDSGIARVKDVGAVWLDEKAVFVPAIMAVSSDVLPGFEDGDRITRFSQKTGGGGSRNPGTYDKALGRVSQIIPLQSGKMASSGALNRDKNSGKVRIEPFLFITYD
jgi:hypothetical protein